jgi:hypothetical protein
MTTYNSPYLYVMNVIGQVAQVTRVATHRIYNAIHQIYNAIHYNSICNFVKIIHFQLLCNSITTTTIMSC